MDADIAIWNPETVRRVALADQHDNMDYEVVRENRTVS